MSPPARDGRSYSAGFQRYLPGQTSPREDATMTTRQKAPAAAQLGLADFIPASLAEPGDLQTAIPRIAKDERLLADIEAAVFSIPTTHELFLGDARNLSSLATASVHLVVTSP